MLIQCIFIFLPLLCVYSLIVQYLQLQCIDRQTDRELDRLTDSKTSSVPRQKEEIWLCVWSNSSYWIWTPDPCSKPVSAKWHAVVSANRIRLLLRILVFVWLLYIPVLSRERVGSPRGFGDWTGDWLMSWFESLSLRAFLFFPLFFF